MGDGQRRREGAIYTATKVGPETHAGHTFKLKSGLIEDVDSSDVRGTIAATAARALGAYTVTDVVVACGGPANELGLLHLGFAYPSHSHPLS